MVSTTISRTPAPVILPKPTGGGRKIPERLVRETIDGVPFYYRGFRSVLNKTKTFEEIMADSSFQIGLKNEIADFLKLKLGKEKYRIWAGETGVHLSPRINLGLDVVVYEKSALPKEKIDNHYASVAPELVVEIDIDVELGDRQKNIFLDYVIPKTRRLLDFGCKRVVWFFSKEKKILIATPTSAIQSQDWSEAVELMPGVSLEVEKLIEAAEI